MSGASKGNRRDPWLADAGNTDSAALNGSYRNRHHTVMKSEKMLFIHFAQEINSLSDKANALQLGSCLLQ